MKKTQIKPADLFKRDILSEFEYRRETGEFFRRRSHAKGRAGALAGTLTNGRYHVSIKGRRYYRSHLVWVVENEVWPEGHIDHINRITTDDRIQNLRDVTPQQNALHQARIDANSGVWRAGDKTSLIVKIRGEGYCYGVYESVPEARYHESSLRKFLYRLLGKDLSEYDVELSSESSGFSEDKITGSDGFFHVNVIFGDQSFYVGAYRTKREAEAALVACRMFRDRLMMDQPVPN